MPDGSVVLVEMFGPRLTRVHPDGSTETIAEIPGGPNGAAVGPDGAIYLCNNGGSFTPVDLGGLILPRPVRPRPLPRRADPARRPPRRHGHRPVHRVRRPPAARPERPGDGRPRRLLVHRPRHPRRTRRTADMTGIYYAHVDGSGISEVVFPTDSPNGIGLSPDTDTLYWAETHTGRVFQRTITSPGELAPAPLDLARRALRVPRLPVARLARRRRRGLGLRCHALQRRHHGDLARRHRRSSTTPPAT